MIIGFMFFDENFYFVLGFQNTQIVKKTCQKTRQIFSLKLNNPTLFYSTFLFLIIFCKKNIIQIFTKFFMKIWVNFQIICGVWSHAQKIHISHRGEGLYNNTKSDLFLSLSFKCSHYIQMHLKKISIQFLYIFFSYFLFMFVCFYLFHRYAEPRLSRLQGESPFWYDLFCSARI